MKVLVTGGTGFLGSHLVDKLLEGADAEIYALARNPAKAQRLSSAGRVHVLKGDLIDVPALPADLDLVCHLAGVTKTFKSSEYYTVNRTGTANLFRALAGLAGVPKIIHISSLAAGGPSVDGRPRREDDPPQPLSPYGRSKLAGEEEALKYRDRFPLVILRAASIYGPGDEDFLDYFRWVRIGLIPVFGRRTKSLSLCYIKDMVTAICRAAQAGTPSGEIFNIAAPQPATWEEIGAAAARILGRKAVRIHIPNWIAFLACAGSEGIARLRKKATALNLSKYEDMKPDAWVADVRKASEILGFQTQWPLADGLRETLDWYVRNGVL